ncbi:MAG: flagellar biosynthetic protein FliQ [Alphaproteobacteria bacterium]|nr:flagellar biosynthetic protein FliQ [Alphaproteobacteria bacterium]
MNETEIIDICREAIMVMLRLAGPLLLAGLILGVIISILQAVTQIQEMTVSFVPKLLVIFLLTLWLMPFMLNDLGQFTNQLMDRVVTGAPAGVI